MHYKLQNPTSKITSLLSTLSIPATGIVPILCPFFLHKEILLSSPALATTKSVKKHKSHKNQTNSSITEFHKLGENANPRNQNREK